MTFEEFHTLLELKAKKLRPIFDRLDLNHDQLLSPEEIAQGLAELYKVPRTILPSISSHLRNRFSCPLKQLAT